MPTHDPAALDAPALARRLHELVGDERKVQVDFLLHLDEFDRRQAFLPAGYGSLWDYCLKALHLREGAAGRRIGAMRVLRRFPALEEPLRDGRLCLSTASLLGQVLTDDNLEQMVSRAAFRTKAEVDHLVASVRPRAAPRDGIRFVPGPASVALRAPAPNAAAVPATGLAPPLVGSEAAARADDARASQPMRSAEVPGVLAQAGICTDPELVPECMRREAGANGLPQAAESDERPPTRRAEVQAVSSDQWSLRVTLDVALKRDLENLTALLSHKIPSGELAEVLREAVQCAIEKHGKRRGAVVPRRSRPERSNAVKPAALGDANGVAANAGNPTTGPGAERAVAAPQDAGLAAARAIPIPRPSRAVPLAVRREVWNRDGGRCTFTSEEGRRCESTWQLELDHVESAALGGEPSVENLRLRCRKHNLHHAEQVFGRQFMARFRRDRSYFQPSIRFGAGARDRASPGRVSGDAPARVNSRSPAIAADSRCSPSDRRATRPVLEVEHDRAR
jgi:hypothetical protein